MKIKRIRVTNSAFNPERAPNQLIRATVAHAEVAAKIKKAKRRARTIKTEGTAAKYLQKLMSKVHPHNAPKKKERRRK